MFLVFILRNLCFPRISINIPKVAFGFYHVGVENKVDISPKIFKFVNVMKIRISKYINVNITLVHAIQHPHFKISYVCSTKQNAENYFRINRNI